MLRSSAEPPPPPVVVTSASSSASAAAAERADISDCVPSELWDDHSDGLGSPLIDIFTETDCSSQVSDDEPTGPGSDAADDLAVLPIAVTEKLIEVVEDDDFGAVSEGGGLIWVVENDVGEACGSEASYSPPQPQHLGQLNGAVNISPQRSPARPVGGTAVRNNHLSKRSTPKKRKLGAKWKGDGTSVSPSRPAKSPRKSLAFDPGSDSMGAVSTDTVAVVQVEELTRTKAAVPVHLQRPLSAAGGAASLQPAAESVGPEVDPAEFAGFTARCWVAARVRWLRQLAGIAAEEWEAGDVSPADAALLRLQELVTTAAARARPPLTAFTSALCGQGSLPVPVTRPPGSAASAVSGGSMGRAGGGHIGDASASDVLPTYVSLMPDSEKDSFKGSFLSMLNLRHVNDPPLPASWPSRTMRQRLRRRKPVAGETVKPEPAVAPRRAGPRSLLAAARRPLALPHGRRVKVLRKPGAGLLRRGFMYQHAGDSSGDEAATATAERRQLRGRRRLLDFSELVEVDGVLDTANTYSGCEEPPHLLSELSPAKEGPPSPPPAPPELTPQRWPRADAARCRICRKFIARVLLPLHLRLHRTGYRGCDICGLVLESSAALYRHRLSHEPPRFPCYRCGRQFDALAKLERHRASAHSLLCARCGAIVPTPELVHDHDCDGRLELPSAALAVSAQQKPQEQKQQQQQEQQQWQQPQQPERASTALASASVAAAAAVAPHETETMSSPGNKLDCDATKDGLVCPACGKSFLLRFNYTMHMKMVHKLLPGLAAGERGPPPPPASAMCPDVLSCLGDILSADLYNEILSVV